MKQYLDLLKAIKERGTIKPGARDNMPYTTSLFGYQFRHNLSEGFPLLTTKEISFNNIVTELLWFLKGETNIKYLVDKGCNIWNEDAYNYYCKIASKNEGDKYNPIMVPVNSKTGERFIPIEFADSYSMYTFEEFIKRIKDTPVSMGSGISYLPWCTYGEDREKYLLGDCGHQYGKVWRNFNGVDQIKNLIEGLKDNPQSRRHIVTAIDPEHDQDLALYWCHAMFQFNCRPMTTLQMENWWLNRYPESYIDNIRLVKEVPKYYLDCQLYQRSADVFLGVPYNLASYALLTEIIASMVNMVPGNFVHTFGDVHIYSNHREQVEEQLTREPRGLPILIFQDEFHYIVEAYRKGGIAIEEFLRLLRGDMFKAICYKPHARIKGKLSTGLK